MDGYSLSCFIENDPWWTLAISIVIVILVMFKMWLDSKCER